MGKIQPDKKNKNAFLGLDIGSHACIVLAELMPNNELVHGFDAVKTQGILNGCIIDPNAFKSSIQLGKDRLTKKYGIHPEYAISNFPFYNVSIIKNASLQFKKRK